MNATGNTRVMLWLITLQAYKYVMTATDNVTDRSVVLDVLNLTNDFISVEACTF